MKRSTHHKFICLLAVIFAMSAGCGSPAPRAPKAVKTVAFITNASTDFWKIARKGCEKADTELADVTVAFKTTNTGATEEQNGLIRDALDMDGADAIAISVIDPAGQKKVINDAAKRALVITQDSDAPDSNRSLYLGADNRAAGRQAGELVKKALPQGGKIMVFVGKREVQNARERFEGLKESLQGSKVEIIDLLTDDADPGRARENAYQTLKKYPDIAGMVGLWSYNGPAILQALRPEGKVGQIKIVCPHHARFGGTRANHLAKIRLYDHLIRKTSGACYPVSSRGAFVFNKDRQPFDVHHLAQSCARVTRRPSSSCIAITSI